MSDFGGLGAGKGWNKFKFVVAPAKLEKAFAGLDYWFVITNQRVNIDYCVNDKASLFNKYRDFFGEITSGRQWDRKEAWQIESGIRLSITQDPNTIRFIEMEDRKGVVSKEFKLVRPSEPVISVSPFYLQYGHSELSIETMNDEGILGLEFSFPKVVSFANEGHESLYDTSSFANSALFDQLVVRVKGSTKKAKLTSPTKIFRPNFWIDVDALDSINMNSYLRSNGLSLM